MVQAAPYVAPAPTVVAPAPAVVAQAPTPYVATAPVAPQVTPAHHPYYAYAPNYHYLPYLTAQVQPAKVQETPAVVAAPTPVAAPVPVNVAPVITKYHSQDEFGQYAFGYNDGITNRDEIRDANGNVKGNSFE